LVRFLWTSKENEQLNSLFSFITFFLDEKSNQKNQALFLLPVSQLVFSTRRDLSRSAPKRVDSWVAPHLPASKTRLKNGNKNRA